MSQQTVSFSLPEFVVRMIGDVQKARHDPTRSDTVRVLLLKALGELGYLKAREMNALMLDFAANEKSPIPA